MFESASFLYDQILYEKGLPRPIEEDSNPCNLYDEKRHVKALIIFVVFIPTFFMVPLYSFLHTFNTAVYLMIGLLLCSRKTINIQIDLQTLTIIS